MMPVLPVCCSNLPCLSVYVRTVDGVVSARQSLADGAAGGQDRVPVLHRDTDTRGQVAGRSAAQNLIWCLLSRYYTVVVLYCTVSTINCMFSYEYESVGEYCIDVYI